MTEFESPQFRSNNWSQADLAQSLATQRPVSAQPINIPLGRLPPNPGGPPRMSELERSVALQEQASRDAEFKAQRQKEQARMEEVYKREQAQRDALRNRTPSAEPPTPRITDRNPSWEQPTPTTKLPTQPGTPNPASLPPTTNTSGARPSAKTSPTAHPAPAVLVKELPPPIAKPPTSFPSSLPKPAAGIYGGAAIGAGIDAGFRIIAGQPPAQVGFGAGGSFAGSVAGALVGSAFGPAGTFVGGLIGGYVGGLIGDAIYNAAFPPPATLPQQGYSGKVEPNYGISPVGYQIFYSVTNANGATQDLYAHVWGPLGAITIIGNSVFIKCHGPYLQGNPAEFKPNQEDFLLYGGGANIVDFQLTKIQRLDGLTDPTGQPQPIPSDNRSPNSYFHPGNQTYSPPRAEPQSKPNPAPNNYGVGGISPGGSPRGDRYDWMPHGFPAPSQNPNPNTTPSNLGGEMPGTSPSPSPNPSGSPSSSGNPGPSPNGGDQSFPSAKPGNFGDSNAQPVPLGSGGTITISGPAAKTPSGLPETRKKEPTSDGNSPAPKNQDPTKPIAQIPPLIIPGASTPKPLSKDETKTAVCELTAPDACLGQPLNNIQNTNQSNSNKLDLLNASLNSLDLAGLAKLNADLAEIKARLMKVDITTTTNLAVTEVVDVKMGGKLKNGLSGALLAVTNNQITHTIINYITLVATFHNAMMLSNNIAQTLFGAIDNVLKFMGITVSDANGEPSNIGSQVNEWSANFFKSLFGAENYTAMTETFAKANRIYQATANLLNSIQSIGHSILGALEVVGSWVASIGNALRKFGEVADNAYRWMNPTPNFQNKFFTTLENVENVVSQIESVTSEVLSVQETVAQIGEQKEQFIKALGEEESSKQGAEPPEAAKVKANADASKRVSATGLQISDTDKEADD
ncbi:hypothetical protein H6G33_17885 [Calothrix sp. FACHB-1219]|uniref:hypothetical protein n=1 Tax=unclassified Calothrix TaxID=2619626 RepID=UPI00168389D7|nr:MULTISPECIES: hypothetical protein [unclassified Calothrix]MBD2202750.1 hypothetical protein [Calothrix sp. FACHB-168]MBD2218903.1 hypothetical protein [Calothrix sp. FACHB-1219]